MKTRDRILNESIKLFAENGFEGTSMASIAKLIGVTKPSLYAHYENKLALFEACLDKISLEQIEFTKGILNNPNLDTAKEKLYSLLKDCSLMVNDSTFTFYNRFNFLPPLELKETIEEKLADSTNKCYELILDTIRDAINSGEIEGSLSKEEVASAYICIMNGMGCNVGSYNNLDYIWKIFCRGVGL